MLKAIGNIGSRTTVLAGVSNLLAQSLLQGRNASQVLGEQGDVIDPALTTIGSIVAIDRSHGDGHQEGVGGGNNLLGNSSFDDQIQAQIQIGSLSLAVCISGCHLDATVSCHVLFQSVLHSGGVCLQACSQSINQNIGLIEELGGIQLISVGVTLSAVFQAQSTQEIGTLYLVDAIQDLNMVVSAAISSGLGELYDFSNLYVAELNALDRVAIACLAIAQIGLIVGIACAVATQDINNTSLIHDAGGNIGRIPDAVLLSVGQIVLIDSQRTLAGLIDGSICYLRCEDSGCTAQTEHQSQAHAHNLLKSLHVAFSFL